ncbi:MAG: tRNA 2-thiouridine(34) synthase MnmA [Candidatus Howiella sp.]|jgi:tRNA-specific 2-thiouridylase
MKKRALVAMSGGVDSSVAAARSVEMGFDCIGVTMKLYDHPQDDHAGTRVCCTLEDTMDARRVAFSLGMRYYVFNFQTDFAAQVMDRFVSVYESGGTPNPCIDCNRYMKFDKLYRRARLLDCDVVVTGHYARVVREEGSGLFRLLRAKNRAKDQSYVLYFLTQKQLRHTLFPLGDFADKREVRALAASYGFANAEKPDSQDICFVPAGGYADFIEAYTGRRYPHGSFVDADGAVLGEHRGIIRYTVGQRRGIGLALQTPMYVRSKDTASNTILLSGEEGLYSDRLLAADFNWIAGNPPDGPVRATAQIRYRGEETTVTAIPLSDGRVEVRFDRPQRAVTAGQAVVLYDGEVCLGGGVIQAK